MIRRLLKYDIDELVSQKDWKTLKDLLKELPAPDVAEILSDIEEDKMVILFRLLPKKQANEVFSQLPYEKKKILLEKLSDKRVREILHSLSPDDRVELFEELPGKVTQWLLNKLSPEDRKEVLSLLGYPENSVGRLMTPHYVAVRSNWTVSQALEHVRKFGKKAETIDTIYVVDDEWHLLDEIKLQDLILADPSDLIEDLMNREVVAVFAKEDQEKAVKLMEKYDLTVLPVVDDEGVLLGIVTIDDIMDVLEEEFTEDVQKTAGVVPLEISYSSASVWRLYKKRIVWLALLLVTSFLSSHVIAHFKDTLSKVIALSFFIPVLIGSGGNTGTQSSTLIIRALATGEVSLRDWFKVLKKELATGFLLGLTLGLLMYIWSHAWRGGAKVSIVVGFSMIFIILWANFIGAILPLILTKLKLDPAVISSPLISTLCDATGLFIYFSVARWWFGL